MGYLIASHLAPAWTGAAIYALGIVSLFPASRVATLSTEEME
jgi:hypothetical protein